MLPTVIEPLREEWALAQAAALTLAADNKHDAAVQELRRLHHRLCTLRVLDPACGSGNFLYVTLEHLKRLEGEVLSAKEREIHEQGLVSVLRQIHDELDAAVLSDLLPLLRVAHGNTRAPAAPVAQVSAAHLGTTRDENPGCASGLPGPPQIGATAKAEQETREQAKRAFDEAILERLVAL